MFEWWTNLFKRSVAATNNAPVKTKDQYSYRLETSVKRSQYGNLFDVSCDVYLVDNEDPDNEEHLIIFKKVRVSPGEIDDYKWAVERRAEEFVKDNRKEREMIARAVSGKYNEKRYL